jgi:hypothetical protein
MIVILAPSNPQIYNRQVFLFTSFIYCHLLSPRRRSGPLRRVTQRGSCLATSGATRAGPIAIDNVPLGVTLVSGLTGKDAENGLFCKKSAPNSRRTSSD